MRNGGPHGPPFLFWAISRYRRSPPRNRPRFRETTPKAAVPIEGLAHPSRPPPSAWRKSERSRRALCAIRRAWPRPDLDYPDRNPSGGAHHVAPHRARLRAPAIGSDRTGKPGKPGKTCKPDLSAQYFRSINSIAPSGMAKPPEILAFRAESTKGCRVSGFASGAGNSL